MTEGHRNLFGDKKTDFLSLFHSVFNSVQDQTLEIVEYKIGLVVSRHKPSPINCRSTSLSPVLGKREKGFGVSELLR